MPSVLDTIIADTRIRIDRAKERIPVKALEDSPHFKVPPLSLRKYLTRSDLSGIIAEIKRRSPSHGVLHRSVSIEQLSVGYMQAGASALSVLTEPTHFGGSLEDLTTARHHNLCPILRKDFIVDEYQVLEAKAAGADAILLIAAALSATEIQSLAQLAQSLGLEVLAEIHEADELERVLIPEIGCIGVNNRDLRDLSISVDRSFAMASNIPPEFVKVAESGLRDPSVVKALRGAGFQGFLIGEAFMRTPDPARACRNFIRSLQDEV
jgi:indole-3-glycerol phosphate synthase